MNAARDERFGHAVALRERGELEEARKVLLEFRAEFPDDAHVAVETAWVHDSLGLEEEAVVTASRTSGRCASSRR
jgi:predicted Zn-dependent protease